MIGGLVAWEAATETAVTSAVRAMADRAGVGAALCAVRGAAGMFTSASTDIMVSTDRVVLAADVDLTNLVELRQAVSVGDDVGRVLAELYALDGPDFVRRLRGAFAIAVWQPRERTLLLAVDQFGIKRLHYTSDPRRTAFASRPTALLGAPGVAAEVDPTAVYTYLNFGYVPAPRSIYQSLARLEPAQRLVARAGTPSLASYWDMRYPEQHVAEAEAAVMLHDVTEAAVGRTMRGSEAKTLGAFLSGGTDSSTVVGLMSRLTGERVNAFSIGFHEERYDELHYADLAAQHFGAAHYKRIVTPGDALAVLPRLVESYDEPFANNSAIGTYFCSELARQCGVTQLLAGDGGDEIFGGNERYRTDRIFGAYHGLPAIVRRGIIEPLLRALPADSPALVGRAQRYVRRANVPNPERFYSYEFFFAREGQALLAPEFLATVAADAPHTVLRTHYDRVHATSELNRLLYLDLKLTIGDSDLLKVTRTAEVAGVRVRFPMLDLALVEFTGTLPASYKVRRLEKRHLFRRAFRQLLPAEILAKRKHGFGVPTSAWLKSDQRFRELARDTLLSPRTRRRGYFRPGALEELFRLQDADDTPYYGDVLWNVLMLELWHRRHAEAAQAAA